MANVLSRRALLAATLLSPVLVALTTWGLSRLQAGLIAASGGQYVRPYGIGYVLPVALLTAVGGWRAGALTLGLSVLSAACFLMPPRLGLAVRDPRDLTELTLVLLVGGLVVAGGEAMRRNTLLLRQSREAAEREGQAVARERAASERQRQFLRDVLASVTDNRLHLCEHPSELPPCEMPIEGPVGLSPQDLRTLRQRVCETAAGAGFPDERCYDLMTAASEAAMNAVVHGGGGEGRVCVRQAGTVQVWVEDRGRGIALEQLPRATLERGHSTAGTLGHGFWLMLRTADRLWLLTGEGGTTVVLEQDRTPPQSVWR